MLHGIPDDKQKVKIECDTNNHQLYDSIHSFYTYLWQTFTITRSSH